MKEMNANPERDEVEIDLGKLMRYYLAHWKGILSIGLVGAAVAFLLTFFLITPQYKADVTIYVNNNSGSQSINEVTGSNLSAAQQLVNTYVNIIKSNTVLNKVIEQGKLDCSANTIRNMMTAKQIDDTEMFVVTISHPDAEMAAHIANTIADVAPKLISQVVEGSSTKIIDYAIVAENPYTPSYPKNIVLGGLLGLVLIGAFLTLRYLFDMRLQDEEDIATYFDEPVLGLIPAFDEPGKSKGGR